MTCDAVADHPTGEVADVVLHHLLDGAPDLSGISPCSLTPPAHTRAFGRSRPAGGPPPLGGRQGTAAGGGAMIPPLGRDHGSFLGPYVSRRRRRPRPPATIRYGGCCLLASPPRVGGAR